MFTDLLGQHFVHTALLAGAVVAVVAGAIGVFVVTRGLSFAVHAISELGFTGATGALVLGLDPVLGLVGGSLVVGASLGAPLAARAGARQRDRRRARVRARRRRALPLALPGLRDRGDEPALREHRRRERRAAPPLAIVAAIVLVALALLYRPLYFAAIDPEVAAARGVPVNALSVAIFLLVALTTAEAIQVVGVLLVLTLVITPAAAAQRLTVRPGLDVPAQHRDRARRHGGRDPALAGQVVADELLHQLDLVRLLRSRASLVRSQENLDPPGSRSQTIAM